ncbi:MAG: N-methylhydantoinase B, partial [Planctomycetota bacterium]
SPVVIWRKELRPDSAGKGKWRGGLGQIVEIGTVDDSPFMVFAMFDRTTHPAHGRLGGEDGQCGVVRIKNGKDLQAKGAQLIEPGDHLEILLPGGGGFGALEERDTELHKQDLQDGLVSI